MGQHVQPGGDPPSLDPCRVLVLPWKHPPIPGRPRGESQRPHEWEPRPSHRGASGLRPCAARRETRDPAASSCGRPQLFTAGEKNHGPAAPAGTWPGRGRLKLDNGLRPGARRACAGVAGGARAAGNAGGGGAHRARGARTPCTCALRAPSPLRGSRGSAAGNDALLEVLFHPASALKCALREKGRDHYVTEVKKCPPHHWVPTSTDALNTAELLKLVYIFGGEEELGAKRCWLLFCC